MKFIITIQTSTKYSGTRKQIFPLSLPFGICHMLLLCYDLQLLFPSHLQSWSLVLIQQLMKLVKMMVPENSPCPCLVETLGILQS